MKFFEIELWDKTKREFLDNLNFDKKNWVATVNPEFFAESWRDKNFLNILKNKTNYNLIDGNGLLWATGLPKNRLISGVDLMDDLCQIAEHKGISVYFLGGYDNASGKTAEYFLKKYKKLKIAGYGEKFEKVKEKKLIFFVALGMKKQEMWIEKNIDFVPPGVVVGVGRSFDYYSGTISRAPKIVREMGFEWLWSALLDFRRLKRQLRNLPWFVWRVLSDRI